MATFMRSQSFRVCRVPIKDRGNVYASDACPSGYAVARPSADPSDAREIMSVDERWRFREVGHKSARVDALASELSVLPPENGSEVSSLSIFSLSNLVVGIINSSLPLMISEPSISKKLIPPSLVLSTSPDHITTSTLIIFSFLTTCPLVSLLVRDVAQIHTCCSFVVDHVHCR